MQVGLKNQGSCSKKTLIGCSWSLQEYGVNYEINALNHQTAHNN